MGILDFFANKELKYEAADTVIAKALSNIGIDANLSEIDRIYDKAIGYVPINAIKLTNSDDLSTSHVAELECKGKKAFQIYASTELVDMTNPLSPKICMPAMKQLSILSATYITVSIIADKRGCTDFVLRNGERVGFGELKNSSHPLHELFPEHANKEIPRQ